MLTELQDYEIYRLLICVWCVLVGICKRAAELGAFLELVCYSVYAISGDGIPICVCQGACAVCEVDGRRGKWKVDALVVT